MLALTFEPCVLTFVLCILTFAPCACDASLLSTDATLPLAQMVVVTSCICNVRWWPPFPAATGADSSLTHMHTVVHPLQLVLVVL